MSVAHFALQMRSETRHRRARGAVFMELVLVLPAFLLTGLAISDACHVLRQQAKLRHGVRAAARLATTGTIVAAAGRPGLPASRLDSIVWVIRQQSGLDIPARDVHVTSITADGRAMAGPGGPGDLATIEVTYEVPPLNAFLSLLFPTGRYTLSIGTSFHNDEFPTRS
jgi:hypothetical protein